MNNTITEDSKSWLNKEVVYGLLVWQVIFLTFAGFMVIVITLCCCLRFRIPRTKQQIEANYQRRVITKKFRQQLEKIQNPDMDSIDLKKALEIIRTNLKIDLENDRENLDHQQSASLISSMVSPVQSQYVTELYSQTKDDLTVKKPSTGLDEPSYKSTHTLNNKQQAEPQTGLKNKRF